MLNRIWSYSNIAISNLIDLGLSGYAPITQRHSIGVDANHNRWQDSKMRNITIKFDDPNPSAYPLQPFTVQADEIALLPQKGDAVTNGHIVRHVEEREFQFGNDEVIIFLRYSR
jgi:hypothetical protein